MANLDVLNGAQYMCLTTYKKSGDAIPTPVWFVREGDKVYAFTLATAGKAKRIRNNGKVEIAPCDARGKVLGETASATARILPKEQNDIANRALNKKYGLIKRVFDLVQMGRERVYIEVTD
jgi:PPOX class probable F420-dependent enzyme